MQLAITNFTTIDNHLFFMTAMIATASPQQSWGIRYAILTAVEGKGTWAI